MIVCVGWVQLAVNSGLTRDTGSLSSIPLRSYFHKVKYVCLSAPVSSPQKSTFTPDGEVEISGSLLTHFIAFSFPVEIIFINFYHMTAK